MQLPNIVTPLAARELAIALDAAWRALFDVSPLRNAILVLLAQSAHETYRWQTVHSFNIASIPSVEGDGRDHTFYRSRETKPSGQTVWREPPHPATRFRAYRTLVEGAIDHVGTLRKRYGAAWDPLALGNPRAFVAALKAGGHLTEGEGTYARAVGTFFGEFSAQLPVVVPELELGTLSDRAQGLVALCLHELGVKPVHELVEVTRSPTPPPPPPVEALELDLEPDVRDTDRPPSLDDELVEERLEHPGPFPGSLHADHRGEFERHAR